MGSGIILANTYHLCFVRGDDLVKAGDCTSSEQDQPDFDEYFRSIHWRIPLYHRRRGVTFKKSPQQLPLSPEKGHLHPKQSGSDIMMSFDECLSSISLVIMWKSIERTVVGANVAWEGSSSPSWSKVFSGLSKGWLKTCAVGLLKDLVSMDFQAILA